MFVSEAMTKNPLTCTVDTPLRDAVAILRQHHIGGLPVLDGDALAGIITESDVIAQLETRRLSEISGSRLPLRLSRFLSGNTSTGRRPRTLCAISGICR